MKLIRAKDYADMSRKAANIISAQVIMKPNCVLGLATGSSPVGTYRHGLPDPACYGFLPPRQRRSTDGKHHI